MRMIAEALPRRWAVRIKAGRGKASTVVRPMRRICGYHVVGRYQHHDIGLNACAVIVQDRGDRGGIAGGDRLAKREVVGQHVSCLQQALAILVEQPQEYALTDLQFLGVALPRDLQPDAIDQQQHACLHHRKQERKDKRHASAETA